MDLAQAAFATENLTFDYDNGTVMDWTTNATFNWSISTWDPASWAWASTNSSLVEIPLGPETHLAFLPSDANLSELPGDRLQRPWVGHGQRSGAHCMCDEGGSGPVETG